MHSCSFLIAQTVILHLRIIPQKEREKRESRYKSGKLGTKFEGRFQNVKLVYKTGISDDY